MTNTQLLEFLNTNVDENQSEELFVLDTTDSVIMNSNDDPNTRIKSWILCTPGCAKTGSFNSFCC